MFDRFSTSRSSQGRCSVKKGVFKNFANFTGKHVLESHFNKVADLKSCNFIKKRLQHRCFLVKFLKFLRIPLFKNICEQLLLYIMLERINPLSANPPKWSNTFEQYVGKLPTSCLSVFDHFVGLALKGLSYQLISAKKTQNL